MYVLEMQGILYYFLNFYLFLFLPYESDVFDQTAL